MWKTLFIIMGLTLFHISIWAQRKDSVHVNKDSTSAAKSKSDSLSGSILQQKKKHDPHKATLYSAILPGAGQVYNGKLWKVPIVYAALGISAYAYFYNKNYYQQCQYALEVANTGPPVDTVGLSKISNAGLKYLASLGTGGTNQIINYRDYFRKNQDYAALFFLLFWGLNIVDATVDAHLRDFNVNSDLSFKIKPAIMPFSRAAGISLVFDFHKGKPRTIDIRN